MIKSKRFTFLMASLIAMLLVANSWVSPAQATNIATIIVTPTSTNASIEVPYILEKVSSAEEQDKLKSIVQYRAPSPYLWNVLESQNSLLSIKAASPPPRTAA